jgi:hypothetical protein
MSAVLVRPNEELELSTGEVLSMLSDDELVQIASNSAKLLSRIARSSHYRRKNRTNIECLEDDRRLIAREQSRRRGLHRISLCGVEYRFSRGWQHEKQDGGFENVYQFVRECPNRHGFSHRNDTETLTLWDSEYKQAASRGMIVVHECDPLAPWRLDAEDKDGGE